MPSSVPLVRSAILAALLVAACSPPQRSDDPCDGVTCSDHGTCTAGSGGATCTCESGFTASGTDCVAEADPCAGVACSGHGLCQVSAGAATCVCDDGFHAEGTICREDVDPCAGVTCSGHGTCRLSGGAARCVCEAGYFEQGLNCELEDPCAGVTCRDYERCSLGDCALRNGRCETTADCVSPKTCDAQHTCVLPANPCAGVTCGGHGTCDASTGTAVCRCDAGWVADGPSCVSEANPCDGVTCSGHGTCAVSSGAAVCLCAEGYLPSGLDCLASPCNGVTCSGHGTCSVVSGAARCSCASGFHAEGLTCVADATACTGVTCSGHGTCSVVSGAATCTCEAGWDASGTECVQGVGAGELILSELMPDPSTTTDTLGEWIELHNATDRAISLAGLTIRVGTSSTAVTVSASIPARGHFVVARSVDAKVPYGATASFSNLANGGGTVALLVRGQVIDSVTFPAVSAGKSFQLSLASYASAAHADFSNWCLARTAIGNGNADLGTPGVANAACGTVVDPCTGVSCNHGRCVANGSAASCTCDTGWDGTACNACAAGFHLDNGACVPNVAPTGLVISEFLASPVALPDAVGEWVELHNAGTAALALDTLELVVDTTSYPLGQTGRTLAPGGYAVLARSPVAPLPSVDAFMSLSLPSSGTHTIGLKLNGVAVGSPVALRAVAGAAWQLDAEGTWCAARTSIGAGNPDLGTPGKANLGCTSACTDADRDGHARPDAALCPSGDDHCDGDPARFTQADCAVCTEGQKRPGTEPCGLNFEGVFEERCTGGMWAPAATCTGTDTCINGQTRAVMCGTTTLGTRTDTCTAGAWVAGACTADECGSNIRAGDVTIKSVTDIAALAGVTGIDGTLTIGGPATATQPVGSDRVHLRGLESLRCVRALAITSNQSLQSLEGLENLVRVMNGATVYFNPRLTSLAGLSGLRSAGSLRVEWMNGITDVNLPALAWVNGDLRIVDNDALTSLAGLRGLRGVAGLFEVTTNPLLQDLTTSGLLRTVGGLRVTDHEELRSLAGLQGLAAVLGPMIVSGNNHVYFEITSGLNITYVKGSISITGNLGMDTIVDGFDALRQVTGDLTFEGHRLLKHYAGFAGLRALGGTLTISNTTVYDVEPIFPALRVIDGDVRLTTMGYITGGVQMPKLERIGGSCVADAASPAEWVGLDSLRVVGGDFVVKNTWRLEKLHLPSLRKVVGSLRVLDSGREALYLYNRMFADVAKLEEVGGTFEVVNVESVIDLTGLEKLARVGGRFVVERNRNLRSIDALAALRWVGLDLVLRSNALTTVRPLYGLTHLGGNLTIQETAPQCEMVELKDHLVLDTGWTGTATIQGTAAACP